MSQTYSVDHPQFLAGQPVWPRNREQEMNLTVGFRGEFEARGVSQAALRVAASSLYRVYVNGQFVAHGPARGPHGYYRVDEWPLTAVLIDGTNVLAIEVVGYNVNSYYVLDQPSFLQAEVSLDGQIVAATGVSGEKAFRGYVLPERVQKVQRYSFQRTFVEVYRLSPGFDSWRSSHAAPAANADLALVSKKRLLPRRAPKPEFLVREPASIVATGRLRTSVKQEKYWIPHTLTGIGPEFKGYDQDELELIPSIELQEMEPVSTEKVDCKYGGEICLEEGAYSILDFGLNLTGFPGARLKCGRDTRLYLVFDEVLSEGDVDFKRLGCVNAVTYELAPGEYEVESFEPYTFRYLKVIVAQGECSLKQLYLREYVNPDTKRAGFAASDQRLESIYQAGVETFRQNAVDIFMDCPSRERAGWLCDSFFTSRVAFDLSGNTHVEKDFLENYLLPESFAHHPKGMLPMCYPSDHYNGNFIPNWAMWFVVQLEEYLERSGDREMVDALKPRVLELFKYFEGFLNNDGLLENLERWVFIEWSKANDFVQDVNYPTNMLYAGALAAAARMYNLPALRQQAEAIRGVIREQAFDGRFFVDNAVRENGRLNVTDNKTEVCQYFAFYFGVADPDRYPDLWQVVVDKLGPQRAKTDELPEVHMANAFIGNYLRLELLSRYGYLAQVQEELVDYFLYMAETTGTLWENVGAYASCNHGFASHVVHVLYRDILGLWHVDPQAKLVKLRFGDLRLGSCKGQIPVGSDLIRLSWQRQGAELHYSLAIPDGYDVQIENCSGLKVVADVSLL